MKHEITRINPSRGSLLVTGVALAVATAYWLVSLVVGLFSASIHPTSILHLGVLFAIAIYAYCTSFISIHAYNALAKRFGGFQFDTAEPPPAHPPVHPGDSGAGAASTQLIH